VAAVTVFLLGFGHVTRRGYLGVYLTGGVVLWFLLNASGIHPTLSGVITALCVPRQEVSRLEKALHGWVAYGIVPLFAYLSSGLALEELSIRALVHMPMSLGIILGLFLGKPIGIMIGVFVARFFSGAPLPSRCSYLQVVGVGFVGGIGFTMSIFVSGLSFGADTHHHLLSISRGAIFFGSIISAIVGAVILKAIKTNAVHPHTDGRE
jgi:NhaA family Na+:H+ antiporter